MKPAKHTWGEANGVQKEGKNCCHCKEWKPLEEFGKLKEAKDGLQYRCKICWNLWQRERDAMFPEQRKIFNARTREKLGPGYWRERGQMLKRTMIDAYGGKCACCGETEIEFLSLDHVNGGGHQERKKLGGGSALIRKLRDANWPNDGSYRILCMNCQFATRFGRTCPHQLPKETSPCTHLSDVASAAT